MTLSQSWRADTGIGWFLWADDWQTLSLWCLTNLGYDPIKPRFLERFGAKPEAKVVIFHTPDDEMLFRLRWL